MLKGNKGEWSEIYAFCYLLNSGILRAADKDLNPRADFFFPIINIIRREENDEELLYYPSDGDTPVKIYKNNELLCECDKKELRESIEYLLKKIPEGKSAFELSGINHFFDSIHIHKLKADSLHKKDIEMKIHDVNTGIMSICGFSIKSYLGANPTLINPSEATNFIYELTGCNDEIMEAVNKIDTRKKLIDKMQYLEDVKCDVITKGKMQSEQFKENIQFVDTMMPEIIGYALKLAYKSKAANGGRNVRNIIKKLKDINPFGFSNTNMYEYKFKKLLCACALGMVPDKKWEGNEEANGGYIVVKQDGSVLCYHLYNRNEFEQYLFDYTCFDSPSTSRYEYMDVCKDKDKYFIKMNLQIRFT